MARVGTTKRDVMNFNGGELSPLLYGRTDLDVWPRGCRQLQNMLPRKYGNAERRVGTQFIAATKFPSKRARNVAFDLSSTVSLNIEMGEYYFRFDRSGAPVMNGSVPYEIVHPYPESALASVMFTQINDVMYVTHPDYPPYKLSHFADNNWTMIPVPFDEPAFKDMNITATTITPSGTTGTITLTASSSLFNAAQVGGYYKLGQIRAANRVELPLTVTGTSSSLDLKGDFTVRTSGTWAGTLEIQRYDASTSTWSTIYTHISDQDRNVEAAYKQDDVSAQWRMVFTFISKDSINPKAYLESAEDYVYGWAKITAFTSSTSVTATVEDQFLNTTATATWYEGAWSPYRGYPAACALFQQRMVYSGTYHQPQTIWGSVSGDYQNFEYGTDDDMGFQYTIGSSERLSTQWLCVHNNALIIGTSTGDWAMSGSNGGDDPVTPTNVIIRRQTTTGDAKIRPIVVDNAILHVQRNGEKLYEMTYSIQSYGYDDADITQFAEHITKGGIIDVAYARQPDGIIFGVRSDGVLLACVYDSGQKVIAWSRIVTQGFVESVAVIYGEYGDEVWLIVRRTLGDGSTVRYKERFYPIRRTSTIDCWYVDSAMNPVRNDYINIATPLICGLNINYFFYGDNHLYWGYGHVDPNYTSGYMDFSDMNGNFYPFDNTIYTYDNTFLDGFIYGIYGNQIIKKDPNGGWSIFHILDNITNGAGTHIPYADSITNDGNNSLYIIKYIKTPWGTFSDHTLVRVDVDGTETTIIGGIYFDSVLYAFGNLYLFDHQIERSLNIYIYSTSGVLIRTISYNNDNYTSYVYARGSSAYSVTNGKIYFFEESATADIIKSIDSSDNISTVCSLPTLGVTGLSAPTDDSPYIYAIAFKPTEGDQGVATVYKINPAGEYTILLTYQGDWNGESELYVR